MEEVGSGYIQQQEATGKGRLPEDGGAYWSAGEAELWGL